MVQSRLLLTVLEAFFLGDSDGRSEAFGDELAGVLMQGAHTVLSLSYSRENEYEADAVAWWATLNAGYPPEATASFFKKLDSSDTATSWLSTHPATKDRIVSLDAKSRELAELRRARGSADVASHFAPALADDTAVGGLFGSMLNAIPPELQKQGLAAAIAGLATLVESVLNELFKEPGDAASSAPPRSGPTVDCEDGESKISFEPVRPGRYVALGHGKCLTSRTCAACSGPAASTSTPTRGSLSATSSGAASTRS
ncbi:unnamed protein product [Prorocentrum cordatum]|uniref:Peptidase M48 domain-containing protein n=1 Tax=Prorocentrum cordatum TaxID=2364126 RepID=A0ABN9QAF8_9DINO|nr:unnamed protein product [Polarella glacialis]